MHLAPHRVLRRVSIYGALLALLGVASLSLTQCTMVGDNITGVSMSEAAAQADKCLKACKKDFDAGTREEVKRNKTNRRQCGDNIVCLAIENERHREALAALEAEYDACRAECHHQGGGGAQ
jgi:hypothetical protein